MRKESPLVHIIIDESGVHSVQIVGPSETHPAGHDIYFQIRDLVLELDKKIQERLKPENHNIN